MDGVQQIDHFETELDRLVNRFRQEYSMPYAAMIGSLSIKVHELSAEACAPEDETEA